MEIVAVFIKFFVLMTPFFALSVFVGVTESMPIAKRRHTAVKTSVAIFIISLIIYFLGDKIFWALGITLDAFKIAAGLVLLLSGLDMVRSTNSSIRSSGDDDDARDPSVVPLAIPCVIGPGTTGALLMMGASAKGSFHQMSMEVLAIAAAILLTGIMLYYSTAIEKLLKKQGLTVLSKLTGLFLASLAIQIMIGGIHSFWTGA